MNKKKDHAFRKDIFLLGADEDGIKYWLEAPRWDCEWYWGFGYVETYTNNENPSKAKDINMHTHIDSEFNKSGAIDLNKCCLVEKTYSIAEGKELAELFTQFYDLKEKAAAAHQNNKNKWEKLNQVTIPPIMDRIMQILTP